MEGSVIPLSWARTFSNVRDTITFLPLSSEMVEPLEETRSELVFATEPILSSLELIIHDSGKNLGLVDLDEVEVHKFFDQLWCTADSQTRQIQKGIIQVCKGLSFLHTSAQLIHSNINPESIIINGAVSPYTSFHKIILNKHLGRLEGLRSRFNDPLTWPRGIPYTLGVPNV